MVRNYCNNWRSWFKELDYCQRFDISDIKYSVFDKAADAADANASYLDVEDLVDMQKL